MVTLAAVWRSPSALGLLYELINSLAIVGDSGCSISVISASFTFFVNAAVVIPLGINSGTEATDKSYKIQKLSCNKMVTTGVT